MGYILTKVLSAQDWQDHHIIRKAELFAGREYDESHVDEYLAGNYPLLLRKDEKTVAAVRLDIKGKQAVIRLLAVARTEQGQGTGRKLQELIFQFVLSLGVKKLFVNAAPQSIGYYEKFGFIREQWNKDELYGIAEDCIQMSKELND